MKLSIVIPYHDEPIDVVLPLLKSIDAQQNIDFSELEILFCRGDTEVFPNIDLNGFINIGSRVKFIFEQSINGCPGINRNIGFKNASGTYISFCDCDDEIYSNTIISTLFKLIDTSDKVIDVYDFPFYCKDITGDAFIDENITPFQLWASIYRKQFLLENYINFDNRYYAEDLGFVCKVSSLNPNRYYCKEPYYYYIVRNNSAVTNRINKYKLFLTDTLSMLFDIKTWREKYQYDYKCILTGMYMILPVISSNLSVELLNGLNQDELSDCLDLLNKFIYQFSPVLYLIGFQDSIENFREIIERF